jgi:hypothetical protein
MPDNNNEVDYIIKTKADMAGAEATAAAMEKSREQAAALAKEMGVVNVSEQEAAKATASLGEKTSDTGKKIEDAGEKASHSSQKHMALRRIFGQLDQISPGLGESLRLVAEAYLGAGEAAEGGAVGVAEFNTALEELLVTLGPLIIAMLGIEATLKFWDLYKTKVEAAAEAQAESTKKIVESTHQALQAVQELDKAMHPEKKNLAGQDEENLKRQQDALDNAYQRQHELNQAEQEKELKNANSPEQKEAITQKFAVANAALEDWRAKQKAAIEGAIVGTIDRQISQTKKAEEGLIDEQRKQFQAQKDARAQIESLQTQRDAATTTRMGPDGISYTTADTEKQAAIDKQIQAAQDAAEAAKKAYEEATGKINKLTEDAGALGQKRAELAGQQRDDAGNAAFNAETNRQRFGVAGINYRPPGAGNTVPAETPAAGVATSAIQADQQTAAAIAAGRSVSPQAISQLQTDAGIIAGHSVTLNEAITVMQTSTQNINAFMEQVQRLTQAFGNLTPRGLSSIADRISTLERTLTNLNTKLERVTSNSDLH